MTIYLRISSYIRNRKPFLIYDFAPAVPEFIDPVFAKTSPKRSFCMTENERIGLVFVKTGSINSGTSFGSENDRFHENKLKTLVFNPICIQRRWYQLVLAEIRLGVSFQILELRRGRDQQVFVDTYI
jgi:hypothetical protein